MNFIQDDEGFVVWDLVPQKQGSLLPAVPIDIGRVSFILGPRGQKTKRQGQAVKVVKRDSR